MNLYENVLKRVSDGARCSVDFKKKTLRLNRKKVELEGDLGVPDKFDSLDQWLDQVEDLYDRYKYSRPTQASMGRERKAKFKALSPAELEKELGRGALQNPLSRDEAQAALEVFILLTLHNGSFQPAELFAKDWFFQGADKSLILCKDWFEPNERKTEITKQTPTQTNH